MKRYFSYILLTILTFGLSTFLVANLNKFFHAQEETFVEEPFQILPKVEQTKTPNFIDYKDLTIKRIGLDSTEQNVIKALGKPRSRKNLGFYNCDETKTISYKGLNFYLAENTETKHWEVYGIELTSNNFQLDSGIKIGDSIESIKQKIDINVSKQNKNEITTISYSNGEGQVVFYFRNNKLEKISWEINLC
jgi:hypothetical protein